MRNNDIAFSVILLILFAPLSLADKVSPQDFIARAKQKVQMGDVTRAELFYMQALQGGANDPAISLPVAEFYIQQNRYDEAEKILGQIDQTNYRVWKARSLIRQAQGNTADSIIALEKALELGGKEDLYILRNLQTYYEISGDTARQKQMENLLQSAMLKTKN